MRTPANSNPGISATLSRSSLRRIVLFAAGLLFLAPSARSQGGEVLYGIQRIPGPRLDRIDQATGGVLESIPLSANQVLPLAIAYDGSRLIGQGNTSWFADRLIRLHSADGSTTHLAPLGSPWGFTASDVDPTTGIVHAVCADQASGTGPYSCSLDRFTGALTVHGPIVGVTNFPTAMGIDPLGTVYIAGGPKIYTLDVPTGIAVPVGILAMGSGWFQDLAFSSSGELWGTFTDQTPGPVNGLYKIDLGALTVVQVIHLAHPYWGLAFGRDTSWTAYCAAKTSSNSCIPAIRASGLASPVANKGFRITADDLPNNKAGLLFYGTNGRASLPFQGGTLCIKSPIGRTNAVFSGGTPPPVQNCSGVWSIDWNEFVWNRFGGAQLGQATAPVLPILIPGTVVNCQWWGRDPGFPAPNNSSLSNAIEFTLAP